MKVEVTMKMIDSSEVGIEMKLSSEDIYTDLLVLEFMDNEGNIRGQFETSKEEFIEAVKQFDKGD